MSLQLIQHALNARIESGARKIIERAVVYAYILIKCLQIRLPGIGDHVPHDLIHRIGQIGVIAHVQVIDRPARTTRGVRQGIPHVAASVGKGAIEIP